MALCTSLWKFWFASEGTCHDTKQLKNEVENHTPFAYTHSGMNAGLRFSIFINSSGYSHGKGPIEKLLSQSSQHLKKQNASFGL